jgi:putative MATE family efflux protein
VVSLAFTPPTAAGAAAVAAHTVGLQLESLARMPAFGISVAATAIVGQRLGARDPKGAESAGWTSTVLGLALIGGIAVLLFTLARPVARLFTDDPQTLALTVRYLRILAVAQPAFLAGVVLTGALRGGGDTGYPLWVSFLSGWVFMLPVAYVAAIVMGLGPGAAWMAQAGSYLVTAVLVGFRYRGGRWKHIAV